MDFPQRHRDFRTSQKRAAKFRWLVKGGTHLSGPRWHALGDGLNQGDPLADAVVDWMHEYGMKAGRALFEQGIRQGVDTFSPQQIEDAGPLLSFLAEVEKRPDWLNNELLALGSRVLDRVHPVSYYVLRDAALMAGYLSSDLNKPLLMTGALQGGASRRVAQTMKWFSDCAESGGLQRQGPGFASTLHVRLLHAMIRKQLYKHRDWDADEMGLPINQTDMVATWLAFSVVFLGGARLMGVPFTKREAKAVMHLWKYACWLMGVDEQWLTDDETEGRRLLFHIFGTYRSANESSRLMGIALKNEVPQIPFPRWRGWVWRWEQAKHLSLTALFVGPKGMKQLGLPMWIPPWYPMLSFPINLLTHTLLRFSPTLQRRYERRGHKARDELVQLHFGIETPDLASFSDQT